MPIYEFRCKECNEEFQELFSTSEIDTNGVVCPKCHAQRAERLLSVFASDLKVERTGTGSLSCGPGCGCHPHH